MTKLIAVLCAALLVLSTGGASVASAAPDARRAQAPSRDVWIKDVNKAVRGSGSYIRQRAATGDPMLAINLDIDNSSIATHYDGRGLPNAIPRILKLAHVAQKKGVALVFNTGRLNKIRKRTLIQLTDAGYDVAMLCMRTKGERLAHSKQRCRDSFNDAGFTLVANIGNNPTDFVGGGYEKAYRLPNYRGALS